MIELIRGLHNLRKHHQGCVATIGNFDGVHLGHQAVIGQLAEKANELCLPTTLITFEPQPQEYFASQASPPRLMRFREKMQALHRYAVDRVLCLAFNDMLAQMPHTQFIEQILVEGLGLKYLVVGDDFRFGRERKGTFSILREAGEKYGFQVVNMHTFSVSGERVSSTRIRQALATGEILLAEELLGRDYRMSGRVAHGKKLGRQLGFPTANIHLHRKVSPLQGIFAVEVYGLESEPLIGVASLGTRPTVSGTRTLLEVYLFDFDEDIYGRHIQVSFRHKLRDEECFDSLDALIVQIEKDVDEAKAFFIN
ncbi:FMN adenylyltransferase / Riboflavin kinase [hydrothermal vent metagenome]|uniref:Bifunctional riboflavin kinase/FMN adenylyltransferase n=1 Tax=hydrothermal vent metagenome TaxID=652676 RepID=A0A3B1B6W2_9ZZZZ